MEIERGKEIDSFSHAHEGRKKTERKIGRGEFLFMEGGGGCEKDEGR